MKHNDFKILIAEDEPSVRRIYLKTFAAEGYEVVMARSGGEILAELREGTFDLLITDMKLDGMSALEALPLIRQNNPKLPIIVVSGYYGSLEEEFHQKGYNINMIFNKPLSLEVLKKAVRHVLGLPEMESSRNDSVA